MPPQNTPPALAPASSPFGKFLIAGVAILAVLGGWWIISSRDAKTKTPEVLKIAVSTPYQLSTGESIVNSVRMAVDEIGGKIGDTRVEVVPLDGGDDQTWTEEAERRNAETAASDPAVVAYIGAENSPASKISMPILNRAGITQISPSNTWPGLTKIGFLPGEPGIFYPTATRHYFRVCATDDLQGPAGAVWAKELGFKKVYILDDGKGYGKEIADLFRAKGETLNIETVGQETISKESDAQAIVSRIKKESPDLVYYGGITSNGIPEVLKALKSAQVKVAFMGPDGILEQDFIDQAGDAAEGAYITTVGAPADKIGTPEADRYFEEYQNRYGKTPEVFGPFAYEAAKVVLTALASAQTPTREGVLSAIKSTTQFNGIFGSFRFNAEGDTSLTLMSGNVVRAGTFEYVKTLRVPQ